MKYVNTFSGLLLATLTFFSCTEHDSKSTPKISATTGVYSKKQVEDGSALYATHCVACHGKDLRGTEGGTTLIGERFLSKWKDKSLGELFELTKTTMPKTNPHSLDDASYSSLLAFIP
jgi:quinoprotein glucose dehydrogenase